MLISNFSQDNPTTSQLEQTLKLIENSNNKTLKLNNNKLQKLIKSFKNQENNPNELDEVILNRYSDFIDENYQDFV